MLSNTRLLFGAIIRAARADCVCDIGSRDGEDALKFRDLCPRARIFAFEANRFNVRTMQADLRLQAAGIEIRPCAVSSAKGVARFNITDVDYANPDENRGTSSLLESDNFAVKETVEVETVRIDEFVADVFPEARAIGLWIDVEGAEHLVLEGMTGIAERVAAIHVETAHRPLRHGQRVAADLEAMLGEMGFDAVAANFSEEDVWGDMIFVNRGFRSRLGVKFLVCKWKAAITWRLSSISGILFDHFPRLHRWLRGIFVKFGS